MRAPHLFLAFCLVALIVAPVHAQTVTASSPNGKVIWAVSFDVPAGTTGTFMASLEDGSTVSGSFSYLPAPLTFVPLTANVGLGSDTSTTAYIAPSNLKMSLWHGDDTNFDRQIKLGYGQFVGVWNDVVIANTTRSPIKSVTISADKFVGLKYEYKDATSAAEQLSGEKKQSLLDFAWSVFWDVYRFITLLYGVLAFLFIGQNLLLIFGLYLAGSMAITAYNVKGNPVKFLPRFFKDQKALFEFMLSLWNMLVSTIGTVIGWFRLI